MHLAGRPDEAAFTEMIEYPHGDDALPRPHSIARHTVHAGDLVGAGRAFGMRTDERAVPVGVVEIVDGAEANDEIVASPTFGQIERLAKPHHTIEVEPLP